MVVKDSLSVNKASVAGNEDNAANTSSFANKGDTKQRRLLSTTQH